VITEINNVIQQQLITMKSEAFRQHNLLTSLADLLQYLLLPKPQPGGVSVSSDIARLMLELDLVKTLTDAIKSIDFNYPDAADAASALVKPLELLSRLASTLVKSKEKSEEDSSNLNTSQMMATDETAEEIEIYQSNPMETEEDEEEEEDDENEDNELLDEEEDENSNSEDEIPNLGNQLVIENDEENNEDEEDDEEENNEEEEDDESLVSSSSSEEIAQNNQGNVFSTEFSFSEMPGTSIVFESRGGNSEDLMRDPMRLLQRLLPNINLEDGPAGLLTGANRRQMEAEVGRLIGQQPRPSVPKWTDDGEKPTPNMIAYSVSFEPLLLEKLNKIANEEKIEKEKLEKEKLEKEKSEKKEEVSVQSPDDKKMDIDTPITTTTTTTATTEPVATPAPTPITTAATTTTTTTAPIVAAPGPSTTTANTISSIVEAFARTAAVQNATASTTPITTATTATTAPVATTTPTTTTTATPAQPAPSASELIDPAFLDALPEELRLELLASQIGANTPSTTGVSTSTLNPDFLAALPPDIQREVLEQENAERERQRRATEQPTADISHAQEMDNASFLATLPPDLRDEILMTSDENFISTLPPQLAAEAHTLQERAMRGFGLGRGFRFGASPFMEAPGMGLNQAIHPHHRGAAEAAKVPVHADTKGKPALEEDTLVTLVKILYMQQPLARGLLQKILQNACYYDISRGNLIKVILAVLMAYIKKNPIVRRFSIFRILIFYFRKLERRLLVTHLLTLWK
jgi:hypothetical protein